MISILSAVAGAAFGFAGDADTLITRKTHTDAFSMRGAEVPAQDSTQTIWIHGKDKLRVEDGERVMIVRLDEKKLYILNPKEKTATTVDLPFDMKKYLPEGAPMPGRSDDAAKPTVTVTVSEESKKVKDWNAKKYTVTRTGGFDASTEEVWASKDLGVDTATFRELMAQMQSLRAGGGDGGADELKKIDGVPVLVDRTRTMRDQKVKSHEEIVAVEHKEAPAASFDVPADYEKKPFDLRSMPGGGRRPGGGAGGPRRGGNDGGAPASKPGGAKAGG